MSAPARDPRSAARYALVLLIPLASGIAIAFLTGVISPPTGGAAAGPVSAQTVGTVIAAVFFGLIALMVIVRVAQAREGTQGSAFVQRVVATLFVYLLIGVAFVVLLRVVVPGGLHGILPGSAAPGGPPFNQSTGPNGTPSGVPLTASPSPPLPGWILYVAIGAIAAVAGAIAVPFWIARRELAAAPTTPSSGAPRSALEEALRALDAAAPDDVRAQIVAVYGRLLGRVTGREGDLSNRTAREIEWICRTRLGIGAGSAAEITGLFEEARYSTHELDGATVDRARAALTSALADLDRAGRSSRL